jgi:hypothetical protein
MRHIPLTDPAGKTIDKWDGWSRPRSDYQWKRGRSAMELAKAWFRTPKSTCPDELTALLESAEVTRGLVLKGGRPELVTPLPERGEGRNHDLWLTGTTIHGKVTVCVEAKADEPFGDRLGKQIQTARKRQPQTRAAERARALLNLLFGGDRNPEGAPWRDLRYQLVTAAAGAVLQAQIDKSVACVLVVHEFHSNLTRADHLAANRADLESFVSLLYPEAGMVVPGQMIGPIPIPAGPLLTGGMPLYVGKVVSDLGQV